MCRIINTSKAELMIGDKILSVIFNSSQSLKLAELTVVTLYEFIKTNKQKQNKTNHCHFREKVTKPW